MNINYFFEWRCRNLTFHHERAVNESQPKCLNVQLIAYFIDAKQKNEVSSLVSSNYFPFTVSMEFAAVNLVRGSTGSMSRVYFTYLYNLVLRSVWYMV
jgi:hypothetical protein